LAARAIEPVSLEVLFDRAEVVYVLAVPSPENRGIESRELMERLDPTDVLVVMSRAHLIEFEALAELVLQGRFRAAIDVFPTEPPIAPDPAGRRRDTQRPSCRRRAGGTAGDRSHGGG
jgi:phosphoglycerate dehydrogenase-like enzyme